jgi:RHS repeat-associated protein
LTAHAPISENAHRGYQLLPASLPRTRTLLPTRRRWRNRVSVRRRASGRVHYNYFRDYDPAIGRYVESDPIGLRGGTNTFAYVDANPLAKIDPSGLMGHGAGPSNYKVSPRTGRCKNCDDPVANFSLGAGGQIGMIAAMPAADSGVAFDTDGNVCAYSLICAASFPTAMAMLPSLYWTASAGNGRLCSGQTECIGAFRVRAVGGGAQGQMLYCGGGFSFGRGGAVVGGTSGGGMIRCQLTLICSKDSDCCQK